MFFNNSEILNKTYEELLDDCRRKRRDEILEFIEEFEEEIKKDMEKVKLNQKRWQIKYVLKKKIK